MGIRVRTEYRVETRWTEGHPRGASAWVPEGDHRVFEHQEDAEKFLVEKRDWYGNPDRFEHRVVARAVSDWGPVVPTLPFQ